MEKELITTLNFVRANGPVSVKEISEKTGLHKLTVHRHLNGGRGKFAHRLFIREKVTEKLLKISEMNKHGVIGNDDYLVLAEAATMLHQNQVEISELKSRGHNLVLLLNDSGIKLNKAKNEIKALKMQLKNLDSENKSLTEENFAIARNS